MYNKLLVGIDGSDISFKALDSAVDLAKKFDAELHIVYVVRLSSGRILSEPSGAVGCPYSKINDVIVSEGLDNLDKAVTIAKNAGITVESHSIYGDPAVVISELAKSLGVDLIVLGTNGKSGIERLLVGSVTTSLVQNSQISTLIIK